MKSLKGKTVLVTGASSGIGEAFAKQFAAYGCHLVLTARSGDKLHQTARELSSAYGIQATVITADLSRPGAGKELAAAIWQQQLEIDILINNAGFGKWAGFLHETPETYQDMIQLNTTTIVELSHLFLPYMLKKKSGGIINIGSTGSFQPAPYIAVYCATKAFVLSFSEALYGEYRDNGVTVTAVCPGNTETAFFRVANANTKGMPAATPEQVASEGVRAFLKGKNYIVTGGWSNYLQSLSSRFLPRKAVIGIVASMFKNRVSHG
ncbi:SDR family oxidoreductase [Chitinophaga sp. HK235]|uniref:SDR family NAD(P)-dependent oxidoreductase n=1 Tax=Chitinophaga sp. HK235 TaxID=2952571 RepID=UPI001BADC136|nr:SDR family oxidoreductase [Chitinophaga sp. HK235]